MILTNPRKMFIAAMMVSTAVVVMVTCIMTANLFTMNSMTPVCCNTVVMAPTKTITGRAFKISKMLLENQIM